MLKKLIFTALGVVFAISTLALIFSTSVQRALDEGLGGGQSPELEREIEEAERISKEKEEAITIIMTAIKGDNRLGVRPTDLRVMANPKGKGIFVYVPETVYFGRKRYLIWLVMEQKAHTLHESSREVTPEFESPKAEDESFWEKTGLDRQFSDEAIRIVFGEEEAE